MEKQLFLNILNEIAPLSLQEEWDNSGLIIGCGEDEATGVMLGFDCTPELIESCHINVRPAGTPYELLAPL